MSRKASRTSSKPMSKRVVRRRGFPCESASEGSSSSGGPLGGPPSSPPSPPSPPPPPPGGLADPRFPKGLLNGGELGGSPPGPDGPPPPPPLSRPLCTEPCPDPGKIGGVVEPGIVLGNGYKGISP